MIGAAASFKVSSRSGPQHEHESFNSRVVPASSRLGLGVIASAGFNSFDSGVETVLAPGLAPFLEAIMRVFSMCLSLTAPSFALVLLLLEGLLGRLLVSTRVSLAVLWISSLILPSIMSRISTSCMLPQVRTKESLDCFEVRESALRMRPGAVVASATAGVVAGVVENDTVPALLECAEVRAQMRCIDSGIGDARRATDAGRPGVSSGIHDSVTVDSSGASSHACVSFLDALLAAPARAPVASDASRTSCTSTVVGLCMHDDDTPMHVAHNSCSDTGRVQGPTGRRCSKGGVSGPPEDVRPCLRGGGRGKFSSGRRCTGAGCRFFPGSNQAQVPAREGAVTPSLHPEVPGIQFVSPGYGLDIRHSMGWTKVCGTARSGIWVLKGIART